MERVLPLGIIVDGLRSIPQVVDAFLDHPYVAASDTAITAPMYKATPELAAAHKAARGSRERLQMYLREGLLDEVVRTQVAQRFAADFRMRYGRGERRDVFLASANIIRVAVTLKSLRSLEPSVRDGVANIIWNEPHDAEALAAELKAASEPASNHANAGKYDPNRYTVEFKLFVDNIHNTYRLKDPLVAEAVQGSGFADPAVLEFWTSPALPGYAWAVVGELAHVAQGIPVWMEQREALR